MQRKLIIALGAVLACFIGASRLYGQAVGGIFGTVVDPTSAALQGAKVTAVNKGTAFVRTTLSGAAGTYSLPNLPIGVYTITVEATGFKVASTDVALDVDQNREVNVTLALSGVITSVRISAAPPLLNTADSTLGGLVTAEQITSLPLETRDVVALVFLQPGVQQDPAETGMHAVANGTFNSNGNRSLSGGSYLDGVPTSDYELGGGQFTNLNLDALAEFRVLQNNYSAQYGQGAGSIILLATKSGTNQFHGSAFGFDRDDRFIGTRNWFNTTIPGLRRVQYGATLGGPVQKDRTFFFGGFAGMREVSGGVTYVQVPTSDQRNGIVDFVGPNTGLPDKLMVPLNSVAQQVLKLYPQPNDPTGIYGAETLLSTVGTPEHMDQGMVRVDHRFSNDKDSVFGEFVILNNALPILDTASAAINPIFSRYRDYNQTLATFAWAHVFGPTMLNTFHASREDSHEILSAVGNNNTGSGPTDVPLTGLSGSSLYQINGNLASYGAAQGGFLIQPEPFTFADDFNVTKGKHSVSVGVLYQWLLNNDWSPAALPGNFTFTPNTPLPVVVPSASGQNDLPAGSPSPSPLISFMLGIPASYSRPVGYPGFTPAAGSSGLILAPYDLRSYKIEGYIQDDARLTRKLTVNLGLRYEFNSVPYEKEGRLINLVDDPNFKGGGLYHQLVLNPKPFYFPDYTGFGARFGLAYAASEKTVLRGGISIYTNLPLMQFTGEASGSTYFSSATSGITNPPYSLTPLTVPSPAPITDLNGNVLPPGGNVANIPANTPPTISFPGCATCRYDAQLVSQNLRNGYTITGNTTLEQALPGDLAMQISYVLNNGVKLYYPSYPNGFDYSAPQYRPYSVLQPGVGGFSSLNNAGHSTYNALQAVLRKISPTHGLQFQVSYTWSHQIDNADGVYNGPGTYLQNPLCTSCTRGNAEADIPQSIVGNVQYVLPLEHWRLLSVFPNRVKEGWQATTIVTAESGSPFTVSDQFGVEGWQVGPLQGGSSGLPDVVRTPTLNTGRQGPPNQLFSNAVLEDSLSGNGVYFSVPGCPQYSCQTQSRPGTESRNSFRTNGWSNVNFSIQKTTKITESMRIEFRAEFFNFLNQVAFSGPGNTLGTSGFGLASSTVNPSREYEFGLRLVF